MVKQVKSNWQIVRSVLSQAKWFKQVKSDYQLQRNGLNRSSWIELTRFDKGAYQGQRRAQGLNTHLGLWLCV